jgi:hypothetical protein
MLQLGQVFGLPSARWVDTILLPAQRFETPSLAAV